MSEQSNPVVLFLINCGNENLQYLLVPVRLEAARNQPSMTFAAKWKELTEVVGVPEGVAGS